MKISPVRSASPAPLPTAAEAAANPALVAPAHAARPRRATGARLGAGLLGSLLAPAASGAGFVLAESGAGAPAETPAAAVPPSPAEAEAAARAEAARAAIATTVAPILQKAMDEEGRGAFGCVAVDPPMVLSENEALNLIEQEFAKAGVKLREAFELTGFTRTRTDWDALRKSRGGNASRPQKTEPGSWIFDFATEDGSILLEYLSTADHSKLEDSEPGTWCSAWGYDFPEIAERFRADVATRTNGVPVTIGVFFDPMASTTVWDAARKESVPRPGSSFAALTDEELKNLDRQKRGEFLHRDARELLREQVRFFLDWARREGKLTAQSAAADEPHAESAEGAEAKPHAESAEDAEN